jgi:Ala-tRNA(Pro) deacylase
MTTAHQTVGEVSVGDEIEVARHRVGETARIGEVVEVFGTREQAHYRIRWDDGHESLFYPGNETSITPRAAGGALAGEQIVTDALRSAHVEFELLSHRRTLTAASEARVLGVLPQETAKTVVVKAGGETARAVVAASDRLDIQRLSDVLGAAAELVHEHELVTLYPEFELGAVPPFGGGHGERVVVDVGLVKFDYVVLPAGTHDRSIRMRVGDLLRIAKAEPAEIARA